MTPLSRDRARAIVDRFGDASVLVIGDVMVDHFLIGTVHRISPEAPVPVLEFDHDEYRVGGAANVAHNVRTLGGRPQLVSVVGTDDAAERLRTELHHAAVDPAGMVPDAERVTTRKLRIVTMRNQQVARVDYEVDGPLSSRSERALAAQIERAAEAVDVIVVSDYLKGVITRDSMARALQCGRTRGIPVLVDPKVPHLPYYTGCSLITPNHYEAEVAARRRIRTDDDARMAARALQADLACERVLITRGEHGMWLLDGRSEAASWEGPLPASAREVSDVTGAGDTVMATIALGLAAGATLVEAAQLANHAAGIAVARFGPATVTTRELLKTFGAAEA